MKYLSKVAAQNQIDPEKPVSEATAARWHDLVKGPRDTGGRRIFTEEVVSLIRKRRAEKA